MAKASGEKRMAEIRAKRMALVEKLKNEGFSSVRYERGDFLFAPGDAEEILKLIEGTKAMVDRIVSDGKKLVALIAVAREVQLMEERV